MKKYIALLITIVLLLSAVFVSCNSENIPINTMESQSTDNTTEYNDGTFIYSGSSIKAANTSISGDIVIPREYNGIVIDTIPKYAFYNCTLITSITVSDNIASIGLGAFNGCRSLKEITLPFVGCSRGNINNSDGVASFGYIFGTDHYDGAVSVLQRTSNSQWGGSQSFRFPLALRKVTITDEVILGFGAFSNCNMLTEINLNDDIVHIGELCFYNCSKIEQINLPSIGIIPRASISYCSALKKFTIGDDVEMIGANAFQGCVLLQSVNSTEKGAFWIPDSVGCIGEGAFNGCINIKSISLPFVGKERGNTGEEALFGYIFGSADYDGGECVLQPGYKSYIPSTLEYVEIRNESVIDFSAFALCSMIDKLDINSTASNNVGEFAFLECVEPNWIDY